MTADRDRQLASLRELLGQQEAELQASRQQVASLLREMEETNQGLIALHTELEDSRTAVARLAAIVQSSDDAMFSLTLTRVIQTWNPGAERLFGYTAAEIVGSSADVLLPDGPDEELEATLKRLRYGERAASFDTRRRRKDGSMVDVAVTLSAMRDTSGTVTGYSAVLRDITDRLRAEAELAAARAAHEVLAERDRMARELHDRVIQRIFAAGMSLQTVAGLAGDRRLSQRIEAVIGELDTSIDEIREAIFMFRHGRREQAGLRDQILTLVSQAAVTLGFVPAIHLDGALESIPADVCLQLLAVAREALSNIARHAHATAAHVTLIAGSDLVLRVSDNGRGLGEVTRTSGLRNMRERAQILGGTFEVMGEPGAGTRLSWRVPLRKRRAGGGSSSAK